MRRHLKRWLNDAALRRFDDSYVGVIESVSEEKVRNRFTAQTQLEPVITFRDGWRCIPNLSMRQALVEMFGAETEAWIGEGLTIGRRPVERCDRETNKKTIRFEKFVSRAAQIRERPNSNEDVAADSVNDPMSVVGKVVWSRRRGGAA